MQKMTWCRFGKTAIKVVAAMILKEERDMILSRADVAEREAATLRARAQDDMEQLRLALQERTSLRAENADLKLVRDVQAAKLEELRGELNVATIKGQDLAIRDIAAGIGCEATAEAIAAKFEEQKRWLKQLNELLSDMQKKFDETDRRRCAALLALGRLSAFASNRIGYELGRGLPDDHELRIQAVIERLSKRGVG